jgi:ABC-type multidrug transport system ATPase subunit
MGSSSEHILEVKNITKVFKADLFKKPHMALNNVSCRFRRAKCTGLLGHNGAGKTTTIRIIFGLVRPTSGEILFDGNPIVADTKIRLGYMPEVNKLPTNLSCQEILNHHLAIYCPDLIAKDRLEKIKLGLAQVGLTDVAHKRVKNLSKGMGRRLAWAQATIHDPELVILDEPFSGLDPVASIDLLKWIKSFKQAGKSLILCTHDLWTVRELCDEVHIFRKGELVYSTLDNAKMSRSAALNSANYQLVVSGVRSEDLAKIAQQAQLKPWEYLSQKDFIARLAFKDYEVASAWLKACLDRGLIVLRFADEIAIEDESIRIFFEGGQLK